MHRNRVLLLLFSRATLAAPTGPQLLLQHGRFWLRSTLHSYCTDSVARWSPRAPLRCVNGVRGLPEPPELHQRLGSVSLGRFAERPAGGGRHVGGLRLQRFKPAR